MFSSCLCMCTMCSPVFSCCQNHQSTVGVLVVLKIPINVNVCVNGSPQWTGGPFVVTDIWLSE